MMCQRTVNNLLIFNAVGGGRKENDGFANGAKKGADLPGVTRDILEKWTERPLLPMP